MTRKDKRETFLALVSGEIDRAIAKHGRAPWGRHELYAILREEVDELWDEIKQDGPTMAVLVESIQIAAVCGRYFETGDKYRGEHPTEIMRP